MDWNNDQPYVEVTDDRPHVEGIDDQPHVDRDGNRPNMERNKKSSHIGADEKSRIDPKTLVELLEKTPGYEIVYKLLSSSQRRCQVATYIGTDGGGIQNWIKKAVEEGLISDELFLEDRKSCRTITLKVEIPDNIVEIIEHRGSQGHRDNHDDHANTNKTSTWLDQYNIDQYISDY